MNELTDNQKQIIADAQGRLLPSERVAVSIAAETGSIEALARFFAEDGIDFKGESNES